MKSKLNLLSCSAALLLALATSALAAAFPPTAWPPTVDANKKVHYWAADELLGVPNANWTNCMTLLADGDQATLLWACDDKVFTNRVGTTTYLNVADTNYTEWATEGTIDVLMQIYGDYGVLEGGSNLAKPRTVRFQEGSSSPTTFTPAGFPTNVFNYRWNWVLYNLTNGWFTNGGVGYHLVGNLKPGSTTTSSPNGGVNKGTLRLVSADGNFIGFRVRAIALGQAGAFGTTNDVNQFDAPLANPVCPAPDVNLVGLDINAGVTNNLEVQDSGDTTVEYLTEVGPVGDQRLAIRPTWFNGSSGYLLNFRITTNYLGQPCTEPLPTKVCVDFFDDVAFAGQGVTFGPEAYAINSCGQVLIYPLASRYVMQGTGKWVRRSWIVPNVNLYGVNTTPDSGGPRFLCGTLPVAVSRVEMAVLRQSGPLAGQDPLAGCVPDPLVCEGAYTNYGELNFSAGITNGLDLGITNTSDTGWIVELAGPTADQRLSLRPLFSPNYYVQFQILTNAFGPSYQDNAQLAVALTYYDDPALAGKKFGIDAWRYSRSGTDTIAASSPNNWITLKGTGKWRDAYWEIDKITFQGVNQTVSGQTIQAAARIKCEDKVHIARVRYAVVRACGPYAGQNQLDTLRVTALAAAPDTNGLVRLSWPYREPQLTVLGQDTLGGAWTTFAPVPIAAEGEQAIIRLSPTNAVQFFRLYRPTIP
jgi:hypothetical protein